MSRYVTLRRETCISCACDIVMSHLGEREKENSVFVYRNKQAGARHSGTLLTTPELQGRSAEVAPSWVGPFFVKPQNFLGRKP